MNLFEYQGKRLYKDFSIPIMPLAAITSEPTSNLDNISLISLFLLFCGLMITIYINKSRNPRNNKGEKDRKSVV